MEDILSRLLVADTMVVQQATSELKAVYKKPESCQELFQLVVLSEKPMIRQYAAILLRKRYSKSTNWKALPKEIKDRAKELMLQGFVHEPEKNVRNAIAQLMGTMIKHEVWGWPQLFQVINELVGSNEIEKKELGMYALSVMTEIAPTAPVFLTESLMTLLGQVITTPETSGIGCDYYVIQTLLHLAPMVATHRELTNAYHQMMMPAMKIVEELAKTDEQRAIESIEFFDELCEHAVQVIGPSVKELTGMCLSIARNSMYSDDLKSRAITLLSTLVKTKKKAIIKHKIIEPIIDVLYELMSAKPKDEEDEDYFAVESEDQKPVMRAAHTMHLLAMHLSPEKLIPHLVLLNFCLYSITPINRRQLRRIKPGLEGNDIYAKKASYLSMAVLAEGCADYITKNYLADFLQCAQSGIINEDPIVRNAALYAAGQFSEYLQPEISRYADQLLPVLFHYLERVNEYTDQEKGDAPRGIVQLYFTLETFCEHLNDGLLPYLPKLMQTFIAYLNNGTSLQVRGLVFSVIGAAANASKEHMLPYFQDIMIHLNPYLTEKQSEETMFLQIQAIETLGVLIRSIGSESLSPVVARSLEFGLILLQQTNDPDMKKVVYGLFASISTVMKKDMAAALPKIVEAMITSIHSCEGIAPCYKEEEIFPAYEEEDSDNDKDEDIEFTDNEDDDEDDGVTGYMVTNAYVEEKEEAILALREIAQYTEEAFLPYIEKSFEETFAVIDYPQEDIRAAAIDGLLQFTVNLSKIETNEGRAALHKALSVFVPKLSVLIRLDKDRTVAINGLGAYATLLKEVKGDVIIGEGHRDAIINSVMEVLDGKTECQEPPDPDNESELEEDDEAEKDELLIENAGDVFSALGKIIPPQDFAAYFPKVFPQLRERLRPSMSEAQRSFAAGTIAECMAGLKETSASFVDDLLPLFYKYTTDESAEVRNNAFYGLGELIFHAKDAMYPHYSNILSLIVEASAREDHPGPRDNMIGVIARMIITNYSILDIDQVFPSFVKQLPLELDFEEYAAVFNSILTLYRAGHEVVKPHLPYLLKLAITVVLSGHEEIQEDETKEIIAQFIKSVQQDFSDIYNSVISEIPPDVAQKMV